MPFSCPHAPHIPHGPPTPHAPPIPHGPPTPHAPPAPPPPPLPTAGKESSPAGSASVQNKAEAQMVLCVYRELVHRCGGHAFTPQGRDTDGAVCIPRACAQ
eukprot:88253-Chlamydomonas_euryale.AAC.1